MINEPVRILHVIGIMNRGGAETMIMNLYRNIDREKIQFDFVENSYDDAAFDDEIKSLGGNIYRCPHYNGKNHVQYVKWWKSFLKEHGNEYKAIHGHLGSTAAIYLWLARKEGLYTIAHSHNTSDKSLKSILYNLYAYPTRYIADYYFACSKDAGMSRYGKKVVENNEKFHVLNNAIQTDLFGYSNEIRKEIRTRYGISDLIVIGHVGRFFTQKNHLFLIDIFVAIHKKNPNTVLLLVGDGELKEDIVQKIKGLGIEKNVILTGVQKNVSQFYQAMDVFVLPSLYEGLGIVAVEAQCTGLPCVISDTVSKECIVTKNQVQVCKLSDSSKKWAVTILKCIQNNRRDSIAQVIEHGYDIHETAKWLSSFYLEIDDGK